LSRLHCADVPARTQGRLGNLRQLVNFIDEAGTMVRPFQYYRNLFIPGTFLNPKPPFSKQLDCTLK
jgi:hypothetical protein